MNIGWILLICAFICLILMAFVSRQRREQGIKNNGLDYSTHLDTLDAMLPNADEVRNLIRSGQTLRAIKLYREGTGASLVDARTAVARMTLRMREEPGMRENTSSEEIGTGQENSPFERELERLLLLGRSRKIEAIKLYREQTGVGLREAKEAVELLEKSLLLNGPKFYLPAQVPTKASDEMPVMEAPNEAVQMLVLAGRKIEAIKLYREQTGVGLREAKDAVDRLESTLLLGGLLSFQPGGVALETPGEALVAEAPNEAVRSLVLEGKKIEAIKLYRDQTGLGLREAKATIDLLEQSLRYGLEQA